VNAENTPDFYTGSPVDATDLKFREEFVEDLWRSLRSQHVILTAPRRTGKTSVMDYMRHFPRGFRVIAVNVQDLKHPADVFQAILDALYDEHPDFVRDRIAARWELLTKAVEKVGEVGFAGFKIALRHSDPDWRANWRQHGEKLLHQIRGQDDSVLIIIDELPDMLQSLHTDDPDLLEQFLAWWRKQRLPPTAPHPKDDRVRWLVGGSVNLKGSLSEWGFVDLVNDLDDLSLPVLTRAQIGEFVRDMLSGRAVRFEKAITGRIIERLGQPIPLFLQMAVQDLYRLWKKLPTKATPDPAPLTVDDVDAVFDGLIRSSAAQDKLQHYYTRIRQYYPEPRRTAAYEVLRQLSLAADGLTRRALQQEFDRVCDDGGHELPQHDRRQQFNQLMLNLENDFYINEIEEDRFGFASGVMQAWWRKYYA